ncbi:hypothetical protein GS464_17885, partial [Rhodococcus hoagii]|nr:hypothetical protein [Prescottella equi]
MLLILSVVIVGRIAFVRERQLDQQITWLLFWWLCAALLREPWLQNLLMDATPLTLSDIRLLTHAAAMFGAASLYLIVRAFSNVRRVRRRTIVGAYALIAVLVPVMAWISARRAAPGSPSKSCTPGARRPTWS